MGLLGVLSICVALILLIWFIVDLKIPLEYGIKGEFNKLPFFLLILSIISATFCFVKENQYGKQEVVTESIEYWREIGHLKFDGIAVVKAFKHTFPKASTFHYSYTKYEFIKEVPLPIIEQP